MLDLKSASYLDLELSSAREPQPTGGTAKNSFLDHNFCRGFLLILQVKIAHRARLLAGSPQYEYCLTQLARFGFRVFKHFLFCFIWDYKTWRDFKSLLKSPNKTKGIIFGDSEPKTSQLC
jgi:hypothetical protein